VTPLPEWIKWMSEHYNGTPGERHEEDQRQLCKALVIAVEAMSVLKNSLTGIYYLGEEKEIKTIDNAMRRIEELGK
jgi:hypothetical protein